MVGNNTNRRSVLKAISSGVAVTGLAGLGSARGDSMTFEEFKRHIERAQEIRQRVDKRTRLKAERIREKGKGDVAKKVRNVRSFTAQKAAEQYLQAHGINAISDRARYEFDTDQMGTMAISPIDTKGVDASVTLYHNCDQNHYKGEISFQLYMEGPDYDDEIEYDYGEAPVDTVGLGWYDPCWEMKSTDLSSTTTTSSNVTTNSDAAGASAQGANVDDAQMWEEWKNEHTIYDAAYTDTEYFGIYFDSYYGVDSDCDTDADTKLAGKYGHTWSASSLSWDVVPSTSGASFDFDYETSVKKDVTKTGVNDTELLRVYISEASEGPYCP